MFARTPRLTLRPGWPEDAPALTRAIAHEAVAFKLSRLPWPYTLDHAQAWLTGEPTPGDYALLIFAHDRGPEPELVGGIGLHLHGPDRTGDGAGELEIGYWLTPGAWGRGYATEAGRAVIDMARHALGLPRLIGRHMVDNPDSGHVLRKLGFRPTGEGRLPCLARGEEVPCVTFELPL